MNNHQPSGHPGYVRGVINGRGVESGSVPAQQEQQQSMAPMPYSHPQMIQAHHQPHFQFYEDPNILRAITQQGAGAYRVHMRVVNDPSQIMQQAPRDGHQRIYVQHTTPFPMGPQDMYPPPHQHPGTVYYPQGVEMQRQYFHHMGGVPVMHRIQGGQPHYVPVVTVDEAQNPQMGGVTMLQATNLTKDPKIKKKKRKRTDPDKPKPARYAWNFYFKEQYQKIRNGGGSGLFDVQQAFTKIGEQLGNTWKALSPEERQPYLDMAAADKRRYEREMEKYKLGLDFKEDTKEEEESKAKEQKTSEDASSTELRIKSDSEVGEQDSEEAKLPENIDASEITADILVTDDDSTFILMMETTLRRLNKKFGKIPKINIEKAKNGEEAIQKVVHEKRKYACITVDKEMGPGADGYEVVKTMRDSGYDGSILGVTGNKDCEAGFQSSGADDTLLKGSNQLYNQIYEYVIEKINNPEEKTKIARGENTNILSEADAKTTKTQTTTENTIAKAGENNSGNSEVKSSDIPVSPSATKSPEKLAESKPEQITAK